MEKRAERIGPKAEIIAVLLLAGLLPFLLSQAAHLFIGDAKHVRLPLHEGFELTGAFIALSVVMILLLRQRYEEASPHLLWVAAALLFMGIMDGVHGFLPTGAAFSWTRHGATLAGGAFFALVWLPLPAAVACRKQHYILSVAVLAIAGSLAILRWPERLPEPWVAGVYSWPVIAANALGGLGFLAAALFFLRRYYLRPETEDLAFGILTVLFGVAGLLFGISHVWAADWWCWHIFRLLAYAIAFAVGYKTIVALYRASELRLRRFYESGLVGMIYWNMDGRITGANDKFLELVGYTRDDLTTGRLDWAAMTPPEYRQGDEDAVRELKAAGILKEPLEKEYIRKDGTRLPISLACAMLDVERYNGVALVLDISRRKEAERALALQARIAGIFLTVPDEEMFNEVLKVVLDILRSPFGVFGYLDEAGALVVPTMTRQIWEKCRVPDKAFVFPRAKWGDSSWPRAIREMKTNYSNEVSTRTPGGHVTVRRHISVPILFQEKVIGLFQVANKETDYTEADIRALEDIAGYVSPLLSARLRRERAQEALRKLNDELERRVAARTRELENANKELEAFSYSVSHDLRAPLRHAGGYADLLAGQFREGLPEKALHYLDAIADSVRQMGVLIDDLLQFSRTGRAEMRRAAADMNGIFQAALEQQLQENAGREVEWVIGKFPPVLCDPALLKLVWANLLANALKFTRTRPRARIEAGFREEGAEFVFFLRDNGVGFDMRYARNLFGVFQRLHATGEFEGTGIGLANVRRIVLRHGGRTWAEAELEKGAVFYFSLPKNEQEVS